MENLGDLFTNRQLTMLTTFADLVSEARKRVIEDATRANTDAQNSDTRDINSYADAISLYLALTVSKLTSYHCTLGVWRSLDGKSGRAFGRQAIPMVWDFPECNPFAKAGGEWIGAINDCAKVLDSFSFRERGSVVQHAAQDALSAFPGKRVFCTDPPYYDNVAYADLSDFFYVWLRRALKPIFPELLSTMTVPKSEELVASAHRHGGHEQAERFFLQGMTSAMTGLAQYAREETPTTIYYAFKQAEDSEDGIASTGWETFLAAVLKAGFTINGTWPLRTEQSAALKSKINSLASSIVLVCRKRSDDAPTVSRRDFLRELNAVLPEALDEMTKGAGGEYSPVAPVDLSQAIIGPGMAVFSKYSAVLEADGTPMSVRTALQLINRFLAEDDFDADTQWCLRWFEQHGWGEGVYGEADVLARSKSISVGGLAEAGVVLSGSGKVSLRKWADYPTDWDPKADTRNPIWETLHQLIRALKQDGESGAGKLLAAVKSQGEATRQLAYRLYTLCERQGWAEDARAYNELITSWTGIESAAGQVPSGQGEFFQ
jgi:putative DNA methylase